jgi:prolyl oligopeptidase
MRHYGFVMIILMAVAGSSCKHEIELTYPQARRVDTVNDYFGTLVKDPYRWLENDTSSETRNWVLAENKLTSWYLSKIPFREKIREKLTRMWNYPRFGVPFKEGPYYFFLKNDGLQNQSVLYIRTSLKDEPKVLLDPNKLSADGTIALTRTSVSHNGKYLAYCLSKSGSDWNEIHVLEIAGRKQLPDTLKWVKFSDMSWQGDGFYYSCYDEPGKGQGFSTENRFNKVYYHKVGTKQNTDRLVYQNLKYPLRNYNSSTTEDEKFLFLYETESTSGNALYYRDLTKHDMPFRLLAEGFANDYRVVDNLGDQILLITNLKAPKKKLVLMDPLKPDPINWKTIIPEREDVLESVNCAGNILVSGYMQNSISKAFIYSMDGKFLYEMNLPGIGTLAGFSSKKGENTAFFTYTSFTFPLTVYKYDISNNISEVYTKVETGFNPEDFEVQQIQYSSKDRTTIPMFIVHKKGILLNGENPALLYGYGGFNISLTPQFSISRLLFLENGGIYAVPNIRGGGEFGENWHKAGIKDKKQNVFDDFIAAAEYLIREKYTSSKKLAIMGGSNGGLLVGAVMTQRPELFKAAVPQVGVMDMLRYNKFTVGGKWASDYGTSDTRDGFKILYKYSPLHNIRTNLNYPATLAFTADHDDRVVPAHTFKFIATLQEKYKGPNPVLVRIEMKAGHGAGKPTSIAIDEATDLWSFLFFQLGMKP